MSERISITLVDGSRHEFVSQEGLDALRLSFEGGFAVITEQWGDRTAIPAYFITLVRETNRKSIKAARAEAGRKP